jgi:hypothetical protein
MSFAEQEMQRITEKICISQRLVERIISFIHVDLSLGLVGFVLIPAV